MFPFSVPVLPDNKKNDRPAFEADLSELKKSRQPKFQKIL